MCTNAHVYLYVCAHKRTCVPLCTWAHSSCSIKRAFLAMAAKRGRRKSERGRSLQLQDLINFKFILSSTWSCFRWSDIKSCFYNFFFTSSHILSLLIIYICSWLALSIYMYSFLINIYSSILWSHICSWLALVEDQRWPKGRKVIEPTARWH